MALNHNYYIALDDVSVGNVKDTAELRDIFYSIVGSDRVAQKYEGLSRWTNDKGDITTRLCIVNFFTGDVMVRDL